MNESKANRKEGKEWWIIYYFHFLMHAYPDYISSNKLAIKNVKDWWKPQEACISHKSDSTVLSATNKKSISEEESKWVCMMSCTPPRWEAK